VFYACLLYLLVKIDSDISAKTLAIGIIWSASPLFVLRLALVQSNLLNLKRRKNNAYPIDKVYTQQISTIMVFVTGVLGGVAGRSAVSASAKAIAKADADADSDPKLEAKE